MMTYKRNKNLGELTGDHTLKGAKIFKTHLQIIKGESKSCNTANKSSLYCTQVVNTKTFKSYQTKRTFKFFHKLNCKSSFVIYLMVCSLCKTQYVGKAETLFNIWLNNQDAKMLIITTQKPSLHPYIWNNLVTTSTNMQNSLLENKFNNTINTHIDTTKIRLKRRKDFRILKLDILTPKGLNQELNIV